MWWKILVYCLLFAGLLLILRSCSFSRKLLYFPVGISKSRQDFIKKYYKDVIEISIPAKNKHTLHGWLIKKDFQKYPAIIYFGGNAEEVSLNIEDFIANLPANVFMINYRGYGLSSGSPSEDKLFADAEKIYDYAVNTFQLSPDSIFTMGRSLGSGVAAYLAVKKNLRKTILITPYNSIEETAKAHFPNLLVNFLLTDRFKTDKLIADFKNEVFLIAAENDEVIPVELAQKLYVQITCKKEIVVIKRAGHNTIQNYREYWSALERAVLN